jgi:hypothetical protein
MFRSGLEAIRAGVPRIKCLMLLANEIRLSRNPESVQKDSLCAQLGHAEKIRSGKGRRKFHCWVGMERVSTNPRDIHVFVTAM